jgi:hypothetical protein
VNGVRVSEQAIVAGKAVATGPLDLATRTFPGYELRPEKWAENADTACQCQGTVGIDSPCSDPTCYLRPPADERCTVNGTPVVELAVLVKPVSLFVTTDSGNHEISRMFFHGGKFLYGSGLERMGGIGTRAVNYKPAEGMYIHLERGYEIFIPESHCQATWKLPD